MGSSNDNKVEIIHTRDGIDLFLYHWDTDIVERPVKVVHIIHGMAEHAGRYVDLAKFLNLHGYVVIAHDQRGHGLSSQSPGQKIGHYGDAKGWELVMQDITLIREWIDKKYHSPQVYILGHSMGSFIAQEYLLQNSNILSGVILSGSSKPNLLSLFFLKLLCYLERVRLGPLGRSSLILAATFKKFNAFFKPNRTDFDWLSRDKIEVDKYIKDELCGFLCSNQLWLDFITGAYKLHHSKREILNKKLPIYFVSGAADPLVLPTGLESLQNIYLKYGFEDVTAEMFDSYRHEIFNEINKDYIYKKVIFWLNSRSAE